MSIEVLCVESELIDPKMLNHTHTHTHLLSIGSLLHWICAYSSMFCVLVTFVFISFITWSFNLEFHATLKEKLMIISHFESGWISIWRHFESFELFAIYQYYSLELRVFILHHYYVSIGFDMWNSTAHILFTAFWIECVCFSIFVFICLLIYLLLTGYYYRVELPIASALKNYSPWTF